jgi:hypothetical protein
MIIEEKGGKCSSKFFLKKGRGFAKCITAC